MKNIANPIYDSVFKYLMEDNRIAKILVSALLKKEVSELTIRAHEYAHPDDLPEKIPVTMYRLDFAARIRNGDGSENQVIIELQKTLYDTETLRFRRYLGLQYMHRDNIREDGYGIPIISIYILGHKLGSLTEPVTYVRRRYLDYDNRLIESEHPFIESLTHDSIIVQVPYLRKREQNRVEQLLSFFVQPQGRTPHYLEVQDETVVQFDEEEHLIFYRLMEAGCSEEVRRSMDIEDEILQELTNRETKALLAQAELEKSKKVIEEKEQLIKEKKQLIEEKEQLIEEKEQLIEEKEQQIEEREQQIEEREQQLEKSERRNIEMTERAAMEKQAMARKLKNKGMATGDIVDITGLEAGEVIGL